MRYPLFLVSFAASLLLAIASPATEVQPNVLFIVVDDLRCSLGCYGDTIVKSPNIDRLASTSRVFNRAYCQQSVCGPSRASILTGRLPDNTAVWHNRNHFRTTHPDLVTLPQLFKNSGYHTQGLGKIFSGDEREEDPPSWTVPTLLRGPGWKNYALPENSKHEGKGPPFEMADVPDDGYTDGKLAGLAVETLEQLKDQSQPFFLAVGFFKPHLPFNSPKKYWDLYDPDQFTLDGRRSRTVGAPEFAYPDHLELAGYQGMPKDERLTDDQARDVRHGYYACISYTDAQVGKLLDALERLQLDKNTIVVLLGDHGYSLGEADHWCKDTNFELDTHVPLMIRSPGLKHPGVSTEALTEYVDIYPTLAELAGVSPPEDIDGQSLMPILNQPDTPGHDVVLSQFSRPFKPNDPQLMGYSIRSPSHRYTRWLDWPTRKIIAEELYDYGSLDSVFNQDVFLVERENVIEQASQSSVCERMRTKMDEVLAARIKPIKAVALPKNPKKKKKLSFMHKSVLFTEGEAGFSLYRIPGIVVTSQGTVLAYCEARKFSEADRGEIEIHLRRSTDGGESWSTAKQVAHLGPRLSRNPHMPDKKTQKDMGGPDEQTVNNPVAIAERQGPVHLIYCVEYMRCFSIRSDDDGVTWSKPVEITSAFDAFRDRIDWQVIATGPGHGIELSNGRLVVPFWMATYDKESSLRKAAAVIYSDDGGNTWEAGEIAVPLGGEPNIVELSDGSVWMTARNTDSRNRRMVATSGDGASGWSSARFVEELLEPGCMAGLVAHPGSKAMAGPLLLFSNPHTTQREHQQRRDVTIKLSRDDGQTWPIAKRIHEGPSAYSDLAVLPDHTILCFYESGSESPPRKRKRPWAYSHLVLARFNLEWITSSGEAN